MVLADSASDSTALSLGLIIPIRPKSIHDKMPLLLPKAFFAAWLNPDAEGLHVSSSGQRWTLGARSPKQSLRGRCER